MNLDEINLDSKSAYQLNEGKAKKKRKKSKKPKKPKKPKKNKKKSKKIDSCMGKMIDTSDKNLFTHLNPLLMEETHELCNLLEKGKLSLLIFI